VSKGKLILELFLQVKYIASIYFSSQMKASTYLKGFDKGVVFTRAFSPSTIHCLHSEGIYNQGGVGILLLDRSTAWVMIQKKTQKSFTWMSSDSHRFWEHPTFQLCTFQLFLLSDRKGENILIVKKSEDLQTSSLSQFYVLYLIEQSTLLLLHTSYGPVHSDYLCISRSGKK